MEETNDTIYEIPEASQERDAVFEGNSVPAEPSPEAPSSEALQERESPFGSELTLILESSSEDEILSLIKKGRSYDEDMAMAEARGEIAGRNAKIENLLDSVAADRHPERNLSSGLSAGKEIRSIFDLADLA